MFQTSVRLIPDTASFLLPRMGSALLSRFDLVFILLDTPNEQHDHLLSEHVIAIRAGKQKAVSSATVTRVLSQDSNTSVLEVVSEKPLSERLKVYMFLKYLVSFYLMCVMGAVSMSQWYMCLSHTGLALDLNIYQHLSPPNRIHLPPCTLTFTAYFGII